MSIYHLKLATENEILKTVYTLCLEVGRLTSRKEVC